VVEDKPGAERVKFEEVMAWVPVPAEKEIKGIVP